MKELPFSWQSRLVLVGCPVRYGRLGWVLFPNSFKNGGGLRMEIDMIRAPGGYLLASWSCNLRGGFLWRGHRHWWDYLRRGFWELFSERGKLWAFTQDPSAKASMWWGSSAMDDWTLPIEFAKNTDERKTPFKFGASIWCRPRTWE